MERTESVRRPGHELIDLIAARDIDNRSVHLRATTEFGGHLIKLVFPIVDRSNGGALLEQAPDRGRTNSASGPSYDDGLAFKTLH
jgi:hypothetical protein